MSAPTDIQALYDHALALVDTLEGIDAQRSALHARYGPGGTFDHDRKILLANVRDSARLQRASTGEKSTEALLDDLAHAHGDYQAFIANAYTERTRLAELDAQRVAVDHRLSLARAMLYAQSRLAGVV